MIDTQHDHPDSELDARLTADAEWCRAHPPFSPELQDAVARAVDAPNRAAQRAHRRQVVVGIVAAAAVVVAVAVTAAVMAHHSTPATTPAQLITCGDAPTSNWPGAGNVEFALSAPTSARSGHVVTATATLRIRPGRQFVIADAGLPLRLLILHGRSVVGEYRGSVGGTGFRYPSRPPTPTPLRFTTSALLSGCPSGRIDPARPDTTRRPLPGGNYDLVAVLHGEGVTQGQVLVTTRAPITITAR